MLREYVAVGTDLAVTLSNGASMLMHIGTKASRQKCCHRESITDLRMAGNFVWTHFFWR